MKESKEFLLGLYREFGDKAQDALNFINRNSGEKATVSPANPSTERIADGIYLIYEDGNYERFDGQNQRDSVAYVGVVYDGHAFAVALEDLGEWPLVADVDNCPEESPFYKTECEGLHDWDFITATKHIQEVGTDIPLKEGEYIPTLAVLDVMCFWKDAINKAISYAGGTPMPVSYHWSSTEYNRNYGRNVGFSNGGTNYNNKYYSRVVRPVAAFPFTPQE